MGLPSITKICMWAVLFCGSGLLMGLKGTAGQQPPRVRPVIIQGRKFVTVFIQNVDNAIPVFEIVIPGTCQPSPSVSMTNNNSNFKKDINIRKRETETIKYPNPQQITRSETSSGSMIITASGDITVMSYNFKGTSGDVALIYPVDQWGTKHYIVTPIDGRSERYAEFAILAYNVLTRVTMLLSGAVQYNGKNYNNGDTLIVDLEPYQFLQLQSKDNLSGTSVDSQYPVAVLSGHSCVPGSRDCRHVYEQLLPEESWGKSYYIPAPSFLCSDSQVYVLASKATQLEYQSGEEKLKTNLEAGKLMTFPVSASKPSSLHSTERIQVLLYGCSRNFQGKPIGSFLTKIPDIESFDLTYNLIGQKDSDTNLAVIIAKTSSIFGFLINGKALENAKWKAFPDSEYVWSVISYGGGFSSNIVQHPTIPFGLLSVGYSKDMAYGTGAVGIQAFTCPLLEPNVPGFLGSFYGITGGKKKKISPLKKLVAKRASGVSGSVSIKYI